MAANLGQIQVCCRPSSPIISQVISMETGFNSQNPRYPVQNTHRRYGYPKNLEIRLEVVELNDFDATEPELSSDGLRVYFTKWLPDYTPNIYMGYRGSLDEPFVDFHLVEGISNPETRASINLRLFFYSIIAGFCVK